MIDSVSTVSPGGVSELADEHDLGSCAARRPGSSPGIPTTFQVRNAFPGDASTDLDNFPVAPVLHKMQTQRMLRGNSANHRVWGCVCRR